MTTKIRPPTWYERPRWIDLPVKILNDRVPGELAVEVEVGEEKLVAQVWAKAVDRERKTLRVMAVGEVEEGGKTYVLIDLPGEVMGRGSRLRAEEGLLPKTA